MFKEYGIGLNFIPTIMPHGTSGCRWRPKSVRLTSEMRWPISGFHVPAITTRKMKTEVELGDGERLSLAG